MSKNVDQPRQTRELRRGVPITIDPDKRTYRSMLARMRRAEERHAELLRSRGWTVIPPEVEVPAGVGLVDVPLPLEEA